MASMLDIAFDFISKSEGEVQFQALWQEVITVSNFSEEEAKNKLPKFYSSLMIDGRFVTLGENTWDLRSRHKYEKVHIDMGDVYRASEEEDTHDDDDDDILVEENEKEVSDEDKDEDNKEKEENY